MTKEEKILCDCISQFELHNKKVKFTVHNFNTHYEIRAFLGEYNTAGLFEPKELKVIGGKEGEWKRIFQNMVDKIREKNIWYNEND